MNVKLSFFRSQDTKGKMAVDGISLVGLRGLACLHVMVSISGILLSSLVSGVGSVSVLKTENSSHLTKNLAKCF